MFKFSLKFSHYPSNTFLPLPLILAFYHSTNYVVKIITKGMEKKLLL